VELIPTKSVGLTLNQDIIATNARGESQHLNV